MESKICSRCKIEKSLEEFNTNKSSPDGRYSICRECQKKKRDSNREEINKKKREDHYKNREANNKRSREYHATHKKLKGTRVGRVEIVCQQCDVVFVVPHCKIKTGRKYCSRECGNAASKGKKKAPVSEVTRKRMSESAKKKPPISEPTRQKMSAVAKGKPHIKAMLAAQKALKDPTIMAERNRKIKETNAKKNIPSTKVELVCPVCNITFKSFMSNIRKGAKYCSKKCSDIGLKGSKLGPMPESQRINLREAMKLRDFNLERNPNWCGGVSFEPYTVEFNKYRKNMVRRNFRYLCAECGKPQEKETRVLHCHHIDYDKKNSHIRNLIPLCQSCHCKTNGKNRRDYFTQRYTLIINQKYGLLTTDPQPTS